MYESVGSLLHNDGNYSHLYVPTENSSLGIFVSKIPVELLGVDCGVDGFKNDIIRGF